MSDWGEKTAKRDAKYEDVANHDRFNDAMSVMSLKKLTKKTRKALKKLGDTEI